MNDSEWEVLEAGDQLEALWGCREEPRGLSEAVATRGELTRWQKVGVFSLLPPLPT